jgi:uncharacterized membrane-anchored protein YjiN (DUF445 family)
VSPVAVHPAEDRACANQRKRARLRSMQRLNLALLAMSIVLLAASVHWRGTWPWLRWMQAFAEASAIGAIADWYAIVALFRRPFGLPVPHSAIIPRNQRGIGESLGRFVSGYLLTPDTIVARLAEYDLARRGSDWLAQPANAAGVAGSMAGFLPALLRAPEDEDLRRLFRDSVLPELQALNAARCIARAMDLLLAAGLERVLLDRALAAADQWLVGHEEMLRGKFAQASRYTPAFVDAYIVRKFIGGVRSLMHDVVGDAGHPLRAELIEALRSWSRELEADPQQRAAAQAWLHRTLDAISGDEDLHRLRDALAARAESDLAREDSRLRRYLAGMLVAAGSAIASDEAILARLNAAWLAFARRLAARHGGQIATLIAQVVRGWDAEQVSARIELEIGRDLQFIRVNGAMVGGAVGLVLYAGTRLIGG